MYDIEYRVGVILRTLLFYYIYILYYYSTINTLLPPLNFAHTYR